MNTYGIFRRERSGVWRNVEPQGYQDRTIDAALDYYRDTYAHDDTDGVEVLIVGPPVALGPPQVRLVRVTIPEPAVRFVPQIDT